MIVKPNVTDAINRIPILYICKTLWVEQHNAFPHFYQSFVFIIEALQMIGYR